MFRRLVWIGLATAAIAALTALIFLVRAGDPGASNWPIHFELRSSDNGVLFQFAQDVVRGRALDWSFSPQVFVFPEIPISLVAYVVAGGVVQGYFLVVAAINSAVLFLGFFAVVRCLYPAEALGRRLLRAGVAMFPLLLLPLLGSTWLFEYQLAPTYYFGMYAMILLVPLLSFSRARWITVMLAVGIAVTAAANPLALVFTVPAVVCVLIVRSAAGEFLSSRRHAIWAGGTVLLAVAIRVLFLGPLQGASPFAYVSTSIFTGRMQVVVAYLREQLSSPLTATVVVAGTVLVVAGLGIAIVISIRLIRRTLANRSGAAAALYFALVPITGLAATVMLLITDYLYLWPVLILPLALVLLPLPRTWVPVAAIVATVSLLVAGSITGGADNLGRVSRYFSYRSDETRCLDAKLPPGMTVGYATFSDARRIGLTSRRGIRLIQLKSSGVLAYWLTNRDYARDNVGQFFYINEHGDEPAIDVGFLVRSFGKPDSSFTCAPGETVLIYTEPGQLAEITSHYATHPATDTTRTRSAAGRTR